MTDSAPSCAVISMPDEVLEAQIRCAERRLILIAPGFTERIAAVIEEKWQKLDPKAVQIVVDPDPEVCRLGFGDLAALQRLQALAQKMGVHIHQQQGLRVAVIVTDETTTVYAPTPRLVESGGQPGDKANAIRFEMPILQEATNSEPDLRAINLRTNPLSNADVQSTAKDLELNPPLKFDLAQKVRVFNALFEFVEFELLGLKIDKKTVRIPPDLIGLAKDPEIQKLLRSSFLLIGDNPEVNAKHIVNTKNELAKNYLPSLPGYGSVILRRNKPHFEAEVERLKQTVEDFKKELEKKLQAAINANREKLVNALLPGVRRSPPDRWIAFIGKDPRPEDTERMLRDELTRLFGQTKDLYRDMKVNLVFKGVTYESLQDPAFIKVAMQKLHLPERVYDEFDAAKTEGQR